ncbi:hypothetical protein FNF27_01621 [Cafeteria roenbergensis]|uniref:EF-hand domain-containing protein n=1 Tax=Cafeteria roenbergensis TaxID=33653 RepID=A0A5A8EGU4_CAFRO|nr:hypothetical protein FNF27_01621 [Cafeteria roenbergensis]
MARMRAIAMLACAAGALVQGRLLEKPGNATVDDALRHSAGADEGHLTPATELEVFLVIVTALVTLSIALESLEHFLRTSTPPEVSVILGVLYGELTTFGTVGILFFVAESTGGLKAIGSTIFGEAHAEALVERVERVDKVLLLLMAVFVATCLVLVWRAWARTSHYMRLEMFAKTPKETLEQAVEALRRDPAVMLSEARRIAALAGDRGAPSQLASSGAPPGGAAASSPAPPKDGRQDASKPAAAFFESAAEAAEAVEYLSLRHQFLYRQRRSRSPPVTRGFNFSLYLAHTLGRDMAAVVHIQVAAWVLLLLCIFAFAPVMLVGIPAVELAVFVAVGVLPLAGLGCLGWHVSQAKQLLVDPTLLREALRRAGAVTSVRGMGTGTAAGSERDSVTSDTRRSAATHDQRGGAASARLRRRAAAGAAGAAGAGDASSPAAAGAATPSLAPTPHPEGEAGRADRAVTALVAEGWPRLHGFRAPYRRGTAASEAAGSSGAEGAPGARAARAASRNGCYGWCCGETRGTEGGSHARTLWFGNASPSAFGFLLTFLCLVNAVYVSVLLGALASALVAILGPWIGLAALLGLLVPPAGFVALLPSVVANMSIVVSVEEMVRSEVVRQATVQQQAQLAGAAVKVLACLANSSKMVEASAMTPAERASRLEAARAALGEEGVAEAMDEAARMFDSFLPPGKEALDKDALARLLTSLGVLGRGDSEAGDAAALRAAMLAMDEDDVSDAERMRQAGEDPAPDGEGAGLLDSVTVSKQEFQHWYIILGPGAPNSAEQDLDVLVDTVFRALDRDGDGEISLSELRSALEGIDPSIDVEAVLAAWDSDRSGALSPEELRHVFVETMR